MRRGIVYTLNTVTRTYIEFIKSLGGLLQLKSKDIITYAITYKIILDVYQVTMQVFETPTIIFCDIVIACWCLFLYFKQVKPSTIA